MRPLTFLLPVLLMLISAATAGAAELLPVKINGLDETLERHVRSAIALPESKTSGAAISEGRLSYYVNNINAMVEDSLEPLGYYQAKVSSRIERDQDRVQLIIDVQLGDAIRVRNLQVKVEGPAADDRVIGFWLEGFEPRQGQVFSHGLYESNKASITQALLDRGYFEQRNTVHKVEVTRATGSADIDLQWDSGVRYNFGAVRFEGHVFEPGLLDQLVNFEQGKPFSQTQINRLQESLAKLNYFSLIQITPDLENKADGVVPILVNLTQGKRSNYNASLRYGSETGVGVEFGLQRLWINSRGHKLDFNAGWAQNEQSFSALYRIPAFKWLDGWYGYGLEVRDEQYLGSPNRYVEAFASRSGEVRSWELLAKINLRRERFDEFIPDRDEDDEAINLYTSVIYPELNAIWRQSDDANYPKHGSAWYYQARAGYEFEASDAPFAQLYVKNKRVFTVGESDNRILLRGELGAIATNSYDLFPPSLRFYAGGDQSLRGYGFKEIGDYVDGLNLGGRYLVIGSVEYQHWILPDWAIAGFVDAGDAFDSDPNVNIGTGLGARWRSPVGPVRLDVAYGFHGPDPGWALHFTLGADL
jgi:translocation and assembly module TamA